MARMMPSPAIRSRLAAGIGRTILEMIEHSGVCAADDVIKILYTDEDFLIEV